MNINDEQAAQIATIGDQIMMKIGDFRTAWEWLKEATEPTTRERYVQRVMTPLQREDADAQALRERTYATTNSRLGLSPLKPVAAPAGLGAVDARAGIEADLLGLADELFRTVTGRQDRPAAAPGTRFHRRSCQCKSLGRLPIPSTLGPRWLDCPNGQCVTCRIVGRCDCDVSDARVVHALHRITRTLPRIRSIEQARDTLTVLRSCERRALLSARVDARPRILIGMECPACQGRTLVLHAESEIPREWGIECTNPSCRCKADTCQCGRTSRYRDFPHVWSNQNDGWTELAKALTPTARERLAAEQANLEAATVALGVAA